VAAVVDDADSELIVRVPRKRAGGAGAHGFDTRYRKCVETNAVVVAGAHAAEA
jgi:hypothetical protein